MGPHHKTLATSRSTILLLDEIEIPQVPCEVIMPMPVRYKLNESRLAGGLFYAGRMLHYEPRVTQRVRESPSGPQIYT